jgi:predicted SAM-dependent methyltransferase
MKLLNIGCGDRFDSEWTNLDIESHSAGIQQHDARQRLPFPDATFDVVYHSHVLEHFEASNGARLLRECHRVLRQGGIIRVAVPDLERIAQLYLLALENAASGEPGWHPRYEWMKLEMYDQTVRERSGGAMPDFLRNSTPADREFISERIGGEMKKMIAAPDQPGRGQNLTAMQRLARIPKLAGRSLLRAALGPKRSAAYSLGRFRQSGEIHLCMYDRYSLARALELAGFSGPRNLAAGESAIPGWTRFQLDVESDGRPYKPDSLHMEATRA